MAVFNQTSLIYSGTFTPTVTLVGGAGNTTPVYTTNTGQFQVSGIYCWFKVLLTGDGGAEGAGTGQVNVNLPLTVSSSAQDLVIDIGTYTNGAIASAGLIGNISPSATKVALYYRPTITTIASLTGADQNNTSRNIHLSGFYRI